MSLDIRATITAFSFSFPGNDLFNPGESGNTRVLGLKVPLSQVGGDGGVGSRFLEIISRAFLVLAAHQERGEDIPELLLTGPEGVHGGMDTL